MVGIFPEKIAGALAYFSFVPAIVFLLVEPYKRNRFVRFHAFQSLFLSASALAVAVLLWLLGKILYIVPVIGHLLIFLISVVVALAVLVIWAVLLIKAYQGESFKLPILGDVAGERAGEP